jgi:hypothetical protein
MGTNYYVSKNHCECCNRSENEYHIGKASYGWQFAFSGYRWNNLTTWASWKEFLKNQRIVDEYGNVIAYEAFIELVESLAPGTLSSSGRPNLNHNECGRTDKYPWFDPEHDWDDPEGYAFTDREFS